MSDEYISIKEFASLAGVSTQAIYQRLGKDLQTFTKLAGKKKMLNIKALELFKDKADVQTVDKLLTSNYQELDKQLVSSLQDALNALSVQLEMKDKQISELNERLKEAQQLNLNNQIVLGSEQSRTNQALLGTQPEEKKAGLLSRIFRKK